MAEVLISFNVAPAAEINYLILDPYVGFGQFQQFLRDASHLADFTVFHNNSTVENDDQLHESFFHEQPIHFEILSPEELTKRQQILSPHTEIQSPQPESKPEAQFKLGATLASVLERFGVNIDISEVKASEFLRQIPFPISMFLKQDVPLGFMQQAVIPIASLLQVSPQELANDLHELLSYLRQPAPAAPPVPEPVLAKPEPVPCIPEPIPEVVEEMLRHVQAQEQSKYQSRELVSHPACCDHCKSHIRGIRYKCLHCPDYDLCNGCEGLNAIQHFHDESHVFAKIYRPNFPGMRCPRRIFRAPSGFIAPHDPSSRSRSFERISRLDNLEKDLAELKLQMASLKRPAM